MSLPPRQHRAVGSISCRLHQQVQGLFCNKFFRADSPCIKVVPTDVAGSIGGTPAPTDTDPCTIRLAGALRGTHRDWITMRVGNSSQSPAGLRRVLDMASVHIAVRRSILPPVEHCRFFKTNLTDRQSLYQHSPRHTCAWHTSCPGQSSIVLWPVECAYRLLPLTQHPCSSPSGLVIYRGWC